MLELDQIRIDGGTQSRVELNQETVAEYAHAFMAGASFPPVVVFFDGANYWLADGFHRYFGARDAGESAIDAEIITGTQRDAVLHSWGANDKHGLPRSNADKRNIVTVILKDEQGCQWSDRDIAKRFGFANSFVSKMRQSLFSENSEKSTDRTYTTKHGTTAVMNTASIGKAQLPKLTPEQVERSAVRIEADMNREKRTQIAELQSDLTDTPEDDGPSADEIAAQHAAEAADRALVATLLESDEPLAALAAENKQLKARLDNAERRINGLMNEKNEAIALVKARDRQIAKLEKMMGTPA